MKSRVSRMYLKRKSHGITQAELTEKTGYSQPMLSMIENGLVPNREQAEKIASALGVSVRDIFPVFPEHPELKNVYPEGYVYPWQREND